MYLGRTGKLKGLTQVMFEQEWIDPDVIFFKHLRMERNNIWINMMS